MHDHKYSYISLNSHPINACMNQPTRSLGHCNSLNNLWTNYLFTWCLGVGIFSKVVATFNYGLGLAGGPFNLFEYHHRGCLNNPTFSNLMLFAACWAHFMCHHELWPTSVNHPFSSLKSFFFWSRLLSLYSFLSLSLLLTFFWLGCYCSMWLYLSQGTN